jgi:hypothetical protein
MCRWLGSGLLNGGGEARARLVSTVTIESQIEPPVGGDRMDRHDVVPVIRLGGRPGWPVVDGRGVGDGASGRRVGVVDRLAFSRCGRVVLETEGSGKIVKGWRMKVAEIFSLGGCGGGHHGGGYGGGGHRGYGGSDRHYGHGDYYMSSYGGHGGEHYDRHEGGGLLGILGGY